MYIYVKKCSIIRQPNTHNTPILRNGIYIYRIYIYIYIYIYTRIYTCIHTRGTRSVPKTVLYRLASMRGRFITTSGGHIAHDA